MCVCVCVTVCECVCVCVCVCVWLLWCTIKTHFSTDFISDSSGQIIDSVKVKSCSHSNGLWE